MRRVRRKAADGGAQVLLMPGKVDEGDQLGAVVANLFGSRCRGQAGTVVDHLAGGIESEDLVTDGTGAPSLNYNANSGG